MARRRVAAPASNDVRPAVLARLRRAATTWERVGGDGFVPPWPRQIERIEAGDAVELARHMLPWSVQADLPVSVRSVMLLPDGSVVPAHVDDTVSRTG